MYPPSFEYLAPRSLDEALAALAEHGDDGRVLAGGQSLIPMMKLRLASPAVLIDINKIPGLDSIESVNGHVHIGALARHADVASSVLIGATSDVMASAAPWIADPLVRNRGTLCGSVAHCDPEGDWNSVLLAARAEVVATGPNGDRAISIDDFVVDFFTNSLRAGEMVTAVLVPKYTRAAGGAYLKLERKIGDYATVGVATQLELDDAGNIAQAGIALTAVNNVNTRASAAEAVLVGQTPSSELFAEAAERTAEAADPEDNVRGPVDYKRHVVRSYTKRALATSLEIAQGR